MNQVDFERRAGQVLEALFEQIDEQLGDWLEVDFEQGILKIELPDGGTYIVNRHGPNREIWLSSPKSGAWHFAATAEGGWRSTRPGPNGLEDLMALLSAELAGASGRAVELGA